MSKYIIGSTQALTAALKVAKAGDIFLLKPGTYNEVNIVNQNFSTPIKITSFDPANPAVLNKLKITNSSGVDISHMKLHTESSSWRDGFRTDSSKNISFDHLEVSGPAGDLSTNNVSAFGIAYSSNVTVTNSEFHHFRHAIGVKGNDGVLIENNVFRDLREDGIRGSMNDNLTVKGNFFTNFFPIESDHADGVQLWTNNSTKGSSNITITDNLMVRGDGQAFQGVFMRDEVKTLPYDNIVVTNNVILGSNHNAIAIDHALSGTISGNTVMGYGERNVWIRTTNSDMKVSDNIAPTYMIEQDQRPLNTIMGVAAFDFDKAISIWSSYHSNVPVADYISFTSSETAESSGTSGGESVNEKIASLRIDVTVDGTKGADDLKVVAGGNTTINAGDGNDSLTGDGAGQHKLIGGKGDDSYGVYGDGEVVVEAAGEGYDTVYSYINYALTDNVEAVVIKVDGLTTVGNSLDNRMTGSSGNDTIDGKGGNDLIISGEGDDTVYGGTGDDVIRAGGGNDTLNGGGGSDQLYGDDGNDIIDGGDGNDSIFGGAGNDIMRGGAGADGFAWQTSDLAPGSMDTILDFTRGSDKMNLRRVDANTKTSADDAFAWLGTAAFTKKAGQLNYKMQDGNAVVSGDINGDGVADFSIKLMGVTSLSASDFVL